MMIEIVVWLVAIVVAVLAGAFSAADSALLAFHASDKFPVSDTAFADRERKHRALSMARVLAYLTAGAALASALNLASLAYPTRVVAMIVTAVLGCVLTEGVGRAVGYANPTAAYERLQPLIELVSRVLRPARRTPSNFAKSSPRKRRYRPPKKS
jgi:CBS domain containing-hemolysin-like protein